VNFRVSPSQAGKYFFLTNSVHRGQQPWWAGFFVLSEKPVRKRTAEITWEFGLLNSERGYFFVKKVIKLPTSPKNSGNLSVQHAEARALTLA
jgi:hypothetical protein